MKHNLLFPLLVFTSTILNAQAIIVDTTRLNIKFNIGVGVITSEYPFSDKIKIDKKIDFQRRSSSFTSYFTGKLTDQPHEHGAIFTNFSSKTTFKKGYTFYANLLLEHRGESYGGNDLNNIVVFPQMYGQIIDTLNVGRTPFEIFVHAGDLNKHKLSNGLQIYNIDVQGVILRLKHNNYYFKTFHLPDASRGIGLALEELFSFTFGFTNDANDLSFSYDLNSNVVKLNPFENIYFPHLSLAYKYKFDKLSNLYFQAGSRRFEGSFGLNKSALVIGADVNFDFQKVRLRLVPEFRYYSNLYNKGYVNQMPLYRDINNSNHYSNTVGRYLYPLKNYYYSFNQWAVFTEYQNEDVTGLNLLADFEYQFSNKTGTSLGTEFLRVETKNSDFNYFFYTWDLFYEPVKDLRISVLVTNKVMNLDAHFQTFYMAKHPSIALHLRKELKPYW